MRLENELSLSTPNLYLFALKMNETKNNIESLSDDLDIPRIKLHLQLEPNTITNSKASFLNLNETWTYSYQTQHFIKLQVNLTN